MTQERMHKCTSQRKMSWNLDQWLIDLVSNSSFSQHSIQEEWKQWQQNEASLAQNTTGGKGLLLLAKEPQNLVTRSARTEFVNYRNWCLIKWIINLKYLPVYQNSIPLFSKYAQCYWLTNYQNCDSKLKTQI